MALAETATRGSYRIFAAVAGVGILRGTFRPNPPPSTTWDLFGAGTIRAAAGSPVVTGANNPRFQSFFRAGDTIHTSGLAPDQTQTILRVDSDTQLTLNAPFGAAVAAGTRYSRGQRPNGFRATGTFRRTLVAVCKNRPNHVYSLMENFPGNSRMTPVYHSSDGGANWVARGTPEVPGTGDVGAGSFQAWYDLCLEVHPHNPELLIAGAVDLHRSIDSGRNWTEIIAWVNYSRGDYAQHADQHDVMFDAQDRLKLWVTNDGGISMVEDVVAGNPATDRTWRKRSHGLLAAQFHDITVHQSYRQMMGGGMQDNGTFVSLGGPTWFNVGIADGGEMAFEVNNPRRYYVPAQNWNRMAISTTVAGNTAVPNLLTAGPPWVIRNPVNADLEPPNDAHAVQIATGGAFPITGGGFAANPFIAITQQHPNAAGRMMVGTANAAAFGTSNSGAAFTDCNLAAVAGAAFAGGEQISALAFGPSVAGVTNAHDWWVGTTRGQLFHAQNAAIPAGAVPAGANWRRVPAAALGLPGGAAANPRISRVAVHPNDGRYVAVATAGNGAAGGTQGRVYLSHDRGVTWRDISGVGVAGATPLPPCPITSLAFDPTPAQAANQVLYAGTLVGVYVIRNLPPRLGPPPPPAPPPPPIPATPAIVAAWRTFNNAGTLHRFNPVLPGGTAYQRERGGATTAAPAGRTISSVAGTNVVTGAGAGTNFNTFFQPGDIIRAANQVRIVVRVLTNTTLITGFHPPASDRFTPALTAATAYARDRNGAITAGGAGRVTSVATSNQVTRSAGPALNTFFQVNDKIIAGGQERVVIQVAANNLRTRHAPVPGQLPLVLINDLHLVRLPAHPGATPGTPEAAVRLRLICATFGRGMYECDLTAPAAPALYGGGPRFRLFIRNYVVEDGLNYPRHRPAALNAVPAANTPGMGGDPRAPAGVVAFDMEKAYDIRVDNAPFLYFDQVVDGVEFDERLPVKSIAPGERNAIYVQVHSRGWAPVPGVSVHLFFATFPVLPEDAFQPALAAGTAFTKEPGSGGPAVAGTGTISSAGNVVTGNGTSFTTFFRQGDLIRTTGLATNQVRVVETITSNTNLTVSFRGPAADRFTPPLAAATTYQRQRAGVTTAAPAGRTISSTDTSNVVTGAGAGTNFNAFFQPGDIISTTGAGRQQARVVVAVQSNTQLTVALKAPVTDRFNPSIPAGTSYTREPAAGGAAAAGPGTIGSVGGSNVVTGAGGTTFSATFTPGDVIHTTGLNPNQSRIVLAVASNTSMTTAAIPLPDFQANFWANYTAAAIPAPAPALAGTRARWQRVGTVQNLGSRVTPNQPAAARFDWDAPASIAGRKVALLAVCTSPQDSLPAAPSQFMRQLLVQERRAALRVVTARQLQPALYIRDGIDDDGSAGAVAFGGRSPDIIVVPSVPASPNTEFRDLLDPRAGDRVRSGVPNHVYVRVHNRKNVAVNADVEVYFAKANVPRSAGEANTPPFDQTKWTQITPIGTASNQAIPANGWGLVHLQWDNPPDPDAGAAEPYRAVLLIALIRSSDRSDALPQRTRVTDLTKFWDFFRILADSNNAAMRALRYHQT